MMEILNCTIEDIDTIFRFYTLASEYMRSKSPVYWPEFERSMIETEIAEARQWKLVVDGQIACVWATTFSDPQIWEEKNADPSVYIHRIATDSSFRGGRLVERIVEWAKGYARENSKTFIRLDTVGNNQGLISHYCHCGFTFLGLVTLKDTSDLPSHYQLGPACLFEIALQPE